MKFVVFLSSFVFLTAQGVLLEGVSVVVGNAVILKSDVSQLVSMTALQSKIDLNKLASEFTNKDTVINGRKDPEIIYNNFRS